MRFCETLLVDIACQWIDTGILVLIVVSVSVAIGNCGTHCQDIIAQLGRMAPNPGMDLLNKPAAKFKGMNLPPGNPAT